MAEDIKDETLENESSQIEEESSDGLIPEDTEETPSEQSEESTDTQEDTTTNEEEDISQEDDASEDTDSQQETAEASQETPEEEIEEHSVQQRQSKLQKILIITIGVLAGILVLGFILYLFGVFDPEPPKPVQTQQMVMDNNQTKKPEKYIFDPKDINIDRLNGKLRILTKYEILGTAEEERQKELEKNSKLSTQQINELLEKEKQAKKEEKLKKEQEELAKQKALEEEKLKKEQEELAKQKALEEEKQNKEQNKLAKDENPYDLLKFIQVSINEEALLNMKQDLENVNVTISNCKDGSRSFLLIGPFKSNKDLNTIFRPIYSNITQSATKKDLARLEFNRVCK